MAPHDRIVCTKCREENARGNRFCWYCGAPLSGRSPRAGLEAVAWDIAVRVARWVVFLAALAGVVFGAYYALDRYAWPALHPTTTVVQVSTTRTIPPSTTTSTQPLRTNRIVAGGSDRYATSLAISKLAFPNGAPALVLVPGEDSSQAITVAPLAAAYDAAVLLVPPDGISSDIGAEIQRIGPSQVFLVGLPEAYVVEGQLKSLLKSTTVTRLIGSDAFQTAALVADQVKTKLGTVTKVVIAPSDSFVEALSVAPLAAANGWPILLSPSKGDIPWRTTAEITKLAATSALVVGLNLKLTLSDVETQTGTNAFDTAGLVLTYAANHGLEFTHTAIANADDFPEALLTGAYLALDRGVLILAKDGTPPDSLLSVLNANMDDVRLLDFIALPKLAKQMTAGSTTTLTTEPGTNESTAPDGTVTTTEPNTVRPASGGY